MSSSSQGSDAFLCPPPVASGATPAASGHGFESVFPFSDASADHARRLSDIARSGRGREDVKVCVGHVVPN